MSARYQIFHDTHYHYDRRLCSFLYLNIYF